MSERNDVATLPYLLSLADSAFPIGGLAHSYGLETAVAEGLVTEGVLAAYLDDWCDESLGVEAVYCMAGTRCAERGEWRRLNQELGARLVGRESRMASLRLGSRFVQLVVQLNAVTSGAKGRRQRRLEELVGGPCHYAPSFGLVGGLFGIDARAVVTGFLTQSVTQWVSAAQRLLPVGQVTAMRLVWGAKPRLGALVERACLVAREDLSCFAPMIEIMSMEHSRLTTRMFLS